MSEYCCAQSKAARALVVLTLPVSPILAIAKLASYATPCIPVPSLAAAAILAT